MKANSPFKLDSYKKRSDRVDVIHRPDSIYAKTWFSNLAVLLFVFIDLFCLKVVWNLVQTEDPLYVWCVALACAAALDVPLAIAAISQKKYQQGICTKTERNTIVCLSIAVFVVAFVFSLGFRVLTRDLSFDISTGTTMVNTLGTGAEAEQTDTPAILFASLFNGVIPLLTSISSFVISYFSCNPVELKLSRLEKERIGLQSNILEAKKALAETETSSEHCIKLIARENDLYAEFIDQLDADALALKQLVRIILMEKLGSPDDITAMSDSAEKLQKETHLSEVAGQELPEYVNKQITEAQNETVTDINFESEKEAA